MFTLGYIKFFSCFGALYDKMSITSFSTCNQIS